MPFQYLFKINDTLKIREINFRETEWSVKPHQIITQAPPELQIHWVQIYTDWERTEKFLSPASSFFLSQV